MSEWPPVSFYIRTNTKTKDYKRKENPAGETSFLMRFIDSIFIHMNGPPLRKRDRLMKNKIIPVLIIVLLLSCGKKTSTEPEPENNNIEYFVSYQGDNENSGTAEEPWKSIDYAVKQLKPGNTLTILKGTYSIADMIRISNVGTEKAPITIQGESDAKIYIDARGANIGWDREYPYVYGSIQIENAAYLILKNLYVINNHFAGINLKKSHHINIINCTTMNSLCSGISAWQECTHIKFLGNTVINANDEEWSWGPFTGNEPPHEAISMAGPHYFEIAFNHVYDCDKEGIDVKENASFGSVHHNYVHHCARQGLYIDGWFDVLQDIDMHHNVVHHCEAGIAVSSENGPNTKNLKIHHNLIYNNRATGIFFSRWGEDNFRENVQVYNNTFSHNGYGKNGLGDPNYWLTGGCYLFTTNLRDVHIINNIFDRNVPFEIGHTEDYGENDFAEKNIVIAYNLINDINTVSNPFYMAAWTKDHVYSITGDHAINSDPLFVNTGSGDFRLTENSPAIDAGDPNADYHDPDGSRNDLGAFPLNSAEDYYWWKSNFPPVIEDLSFLE